MIARTPTPAPTLIDPHGLEALVRHVVAETIEAMLAADRRIPATQLLFGEAQAAALLDVPIHVLRDARLRGQIAATKIGRQVRYHRDVLIRAAINGIA